MEFSSHQSGTFCWADLATNNAEAAKAFYNKIFGVEALDLPSDGSMPYTMLNLNNKSVAALYPLAPEHLEMNIPPHWMSYIACDDIHSTVEKVKENGGNVFMGPWEAATFGIGAMIQDPEGAMVGLWQAKSHIGTAFKNIHGTVCWFEHGSHGKPETIKFYENVFGYKAHTQMMGDTEYTTFFLGEYPAAGLYKLPENMSELPAHWLVYFAVDCIETALAVAFNEKAEILMPKMEVPGIGFFAVIRDPQGAVLGLLEAAKAQLYCRIYQLTNTNALHLSDVGHLYIMKANNSNGRCQERHLQC